MTQAVPSIDADVYDRLTDQQERVVKRWELAQKISVCIPPILFVLSAVLVGLGVGGLVNPLAGVYTFAASIGAWICIVEPINCCRQRVRERYGLPPYEPPPPEPAEDSDIPANIEYPEEEEDARPEANEELEG